jgi:hypothetical protein
VVKFNEVTILQKNIIKNIKILKISGKNVSSKSINKYFEIKKNNEQIIKIKFD